MAAIALPPPTPRDAEIRAAVLPLVEVCAWAEAAAAIEARRREIAETRERHLERLFRDWSALDPAARPDFLTYAHHRRMPELEHGR